VAMLLHTELLPEAQVNIEIFVLCVSERCEFLSLELGSTEEGKSKLYVLVLASKTK